MVAPERGLDVKSRKCGVTKQLLEAKPSTSDLALRTRIPVVRLKLPAASGGECAHYYSSKVQGMGRIGFAVWETGKPIVAITHSPSQHLDKQYGQCDYAQALHLLVGSCFETHFPVGLAVF